MTKIWVFRLTLGPGKEPKRPCPINGRKLHDEVERYRKDFLPVYEEEMNEEYELVNELTMNVLKDELFERGKLRQGWGMSFENMNTDLRREKEEWIQDFINLYWRLYGERIDCSIAYGRYSVLHVMNEEMNVGDIVYIPKMPYDDYFTIAKIKKGYKFDPIEYYLEHGHSITVENIKIFNYGSKIEKRTFMSNRKAISEVKKHHMNYSILNAFSKNMDNI